MTQPDQHAPDRTDAVASWTEPEGLNPRGTVIVIPGRGERPGVYGRFGRRDGPAQDAAPRGHGPGGGA